MRKRFLWRAHDDVALVATVESLVLSTRTYPQFLLRLKQLFPSSYLL